MALPSMPTFTNIDPHIANTESKSFSGPSVSSQLDQLHLHHSGGSQSGPSSARSPNPLRAPAEAVFQHAQQNRARAYAEPQGILSTPSFRREIYSEADIMRFISLYEQQYQISLSLIDIAGRNHSRDVVASTVQDLRAKLVAAEEKQRELEAFRDVDTEAKRLLKMLPASRYQYRQSYKQGLSGNKRQLIVTQFNSDEQFIQHGGIRYDRFRHHVPNAEAPVPQEQEDG